MQNGDNIFSEKKPIGVNEIISYLSELESIVHIGKDSLREKLVRLSKSVDKKIPYRDGHSIRVSKFSREIAMRIKLTKNEIFNIEISALLHDFGKIAIEENILQKREELTEADWREIKLHPIRGYYLIQGFEFLKETLPGIRWHHERINGSGYPDKLKGDEIPLPARIIAVSDAFDAMTQKRPYNKKIRIKNAITILRNNIDVLFDRKIVTAFLKIPHKIIISILNEFF